MLTIARLTDIELIAEVMRHPKIYPAISDDGSPKREEYTPPVGGLYAGVFEGDELMGLFAFFPVNCATVEVHTCLLPKCWGKAVEAARSAREWLWRSTAYRRIITSVPSMNRLARRLALCSGMTEYGNNPQAYMKNGKLFDIQMLGISREAV